MIPLSDVEPNRYTSIPVMTLAIISINILMMVLEEIVIDIDFNQFLALINTYGSTPALILNRQGAGGITAVTSIFIHDGFWHLFGNMLGLWVYGRRVEDACGPWRFLSFYLISGIFANIVHILTDIHSDIPTIGASGAVFGVMGAYLILFPKGRIRTFILLGIIPLFPKIRAYWLILYFLVLEIIPAYQVLIENADYRVAHWAHLGGFIGSLFIFFFLRPDAFHRYRNELPL